MLFELTAIPMELRRPSAERIVHFAFLVGRYRRAVRKARADTARMKNAAPLRSDFLDDAAAHA